MIRRKDRSNKPPGRLRGVKIRLRDWLVLPLLLIAIWWDRNRDGSDADDLKLPQDEGLLGWAAFVLVMSLAGFAFVLCLWMADMLLHEADRQKERLRAA